MAYYRALSNLDTGHGIIESGQVFPERRLAAMAIARLSEMGKIAMVSMPPLEALPGWKVRASRLPGMKVDEFLDMPDDELAGKLSTKKTSYKPEQVAAMKAQLLAMMAAPKNPSRG